MNSTTGIRNRRHDGDSTVFSTTNATTPRTDSTTNIMTVERKTAALTCCRPSTVRSWGMNFPMLWVSQVVNTSLTGDATTRNRL